VTTIVIVGAGFAGLSALLSLLKQRVKAKIILIDKDDHFEYTPALHLCLTNPSYIDCIRFSLKEFYSDFFVKAKVKKITRTQVITDTDTFTYDYLVLATGSKTNDFGNASLRKFTYSVKRVADVLQLLPKLDTAKHITIIGAGYTGVELAAILAEDTSKTIHLIDGDKQVLHASNKPTQKVVKKYLQKNHVHFHLGNSIQSCTADSVTLSTGEVLQSDLHILSAGIKPNDQCLPALSTFPSLDVKERKRVFVCGDVARCGVAATGHNAMIEGRLVGRNIAASIQGKPLEDLHISSTVLGIALGHYWGTIPLGKTALTTVGTGFLKWLVMKRCLFEFKHRIMLPL